MFLSKGEICELTDYKRFADQRKWLHERAWVFEVASTGRPVVSRAYADSRMGSARNSSQLWAPNVAAIRKLA